MTNTKKFLKAMAKSLYVEYQNISLHFSLSIWNLDYSWWMGEFYFCLSFPYKQEVGAGLFAGFPGEGKMIYLDDDIVRELITVCMNMC